MSQDPTVRINRIFADAVFGTYRKKRYGIKSCRVQYDPEYLNDLRELDKRGEELQACDRVLGTGCHPTKIEETIKTL